MRRGRVLLVTVAAAPAVMAPEARGASPGDVDTDFGAGGRLQYSPPDGTLLGGDLDVRPGGRLVALV